VEYLARFRRWRRSAGVPEAGGREAGWGAGVRRRGLRSGMTDGGEDGNVALPRGPARRRGPVRASFDADEFIALMHGSDPVRVELTRLENELRGGFHDLSVDFVL
jgi:hypothetical protein